MLSEILNYFLSKLTPKIRTFNGVARIFVWGGATRLTPPDTFCVVSGSRPDSVGGGVVAEIIFRDPRQRTRFSGGGGGGSRHFS